MPFGTTTRSDVEFRTNLGVFRAEMGEIHAAYARTTGGMSTESLRAAVAQEKLDRVLAKYAPESFRAKQATLTYRKEMSALAAEGPRVASAIDRDERALGRFSRGAIVGSGAMGSFRRAILLGSSSLLGGFGLAYAIRTVITESRKHLLVVAQTKQALEGQKISWQDNAAAIDEAIHRLSKLSAFEDEELYVSFTALFRRTGDVTEALRLNGIAADVARGRNIDLETAVRLVTRASIGQVGSLRRLGLDVSAVTTNQNRLTDSTKNATREQKNAAAAADKRATQEKVLALLQAKYGGAAAVFAKSDAGAQAKFTNALHDSEEEIGTGLLPTLTRLLKHGTTYLDQMNKSGRLQREVNRDLHTAGEAVHGLADAFHLTVVVLRPVVAALGGTRNAVKGLALVYVLVKLNALAAAVGLKSAGAAATVAGDESAAAAGKVSLLGKRLSSLPTRIGIQVAVAYFAYGPLKNAFEKYLGADFAGTGSGKGDLVPAGDTFLKQAIAKVRAMRKDGMRTEAQIRAALAAEGTFTTDEIDQAMRADVKTGEDVRLRGLGSLDSAPATKRRKPLTLTQQYDLASERYAQAQAGHDVVAQRKALADQERILHEQLAVTKDVNKRRDLFDLITAAEGSVDALDQAAQTKRDAARQKADEQAKKADAKRKAAAKARHDAAVKQRAAQVTLLTNAPLELRIAEQTALAHHASEARLLAIYRSELAALEQQIGVIRKLGLGRQAVLDARTKEAAIQKKITALTKHTTKSAQDVFAEAANEFRLYGSNVGGRESVLSGQDARGLLAEILLVSRDSAKANKKTAEHTHAIKNAKPTGIHGARTAAAHGASSP